MARRSGLLGWGVDDGRAERLGLDRDGELGEVGVADHLAELLLGFEHPGGRPAERHLAVLPALDVAAEIEPKSRVGRRNVPIAGVLRDHLVERRMQAQRGEGLVFGVTPTVPFTPSAVRKRAHAGWEAASLERITLHEARHTFASLMIAAGVNAKALSTYMGHANISITLDRYGHLMPGNEQQAASLLNAYLEQAARSADLGAESLNVEVTDA